MEGSPALQRGDQEEDTQVPREEGIQVLREGDSQPLKVEDSLRRQVEGKPWSIYATLNDQTNDHFRLMKQAAFDHAPSIFL